MAAGEDALGETAEKKFVNAVWALDCVDEGNTAF
jgi:hypothetical protein